ncbi:MAG: insulinase family protein [Bacteroidales bacterium]|nr:insulinase family protein [Bacteroidales bacterium]
MKKISKRLFATVCLGLFAVTLFAQTMNLPVDPKVRTGKLDNGLTYYIRHNELPKERADFYIAQKVGSILEEDSQRGLAHFLEHMAFNGTENFPKRGLLDYLESVGVKFGYNINAYTAFDETVYNLSNVPVVREGIIDSALLVLHDWSNFLSLEDEEIDKERGVIHEEWRSRSDANLRVWEQLFPIIYEGSQYAHRFPIGLMDVVDNFEYQVLRDYYEKWYRPDLQAIIVVGDIDVDQIEAKIKTMFADIPAPTDPAERIYYEVGDNAEPIIAFATDPELPYTAVSLFYKQDPLPSEHKNTPTFFAIKFISDVAAAMMNQRLNELMQKPNPPFNYAAQEYGDFFVAKTKDAWMVFVVTKEGGVEESLNAIIIENERAKKFGFTESEYERAKADFLKQVESQYENRETQKNESYSREYVRNFADADPIPGIEMEYMLYNQLAPMIPVSAVNEFMAEMISDDNLVVTITGPEKEGLVYPSKEAVLNIIQQAKASEITAYEDTVSDEPLITKEPQAGSIKSETKLADLDVTEWTLSNGVKVILKPTKFKEDEVLMEGFSWGGTSSLDIADAATIQMLNDLYTVGGVGNFSAVDLPKVLAGKKASVTPSSGRLTDRLSGSCSPKDFETMMQLAYLYFTQPRNDDEAYQSFFSRQKTMLEAQEAHPLVTFQDSISSVLYDNFPTATRMKASDMDKVDYTKAMSIYKNLFGSVENFTFTFVGNFDVETIRPYILQYLGGIPAGKEKKSWKDDGLKIPETNVVRRYDKKMEIPTTTILLVYSGDLTYSLESKMMLSVMADILNLVYTEKIREDEGGTYGVSVRGQLAKYPKEAFTFQIFFQTNPDVYDKLIGIAKDEITELAVNGPRETDVSKVKENLLKKYAEDLEENKYWQEIFSQYILFGLNEYKDYTSFVDKISVESIQKFAKQFVDNGYLKEVVQNPKE